MRLFGRTKVQSMEKELSALRQEYKSIKNLQSLIIDDILTAQEIGKRYKGNAYQSYELAIKAIDEKYRGVADWGVLQTGNIVDLRASFIISQGIKVLKLKEDGDREVSFVKDFLDYNNLDAEIIQEFAKEAEIEGKILLRLAIDDLRTTPFQNRYEPKNPHLIMINVRFLSWSEKKYAIDTPSDDYLKYEKASWTPVGASQKVTLEAPRFVYKKFGGRISDPNQAQPRIMKCLTQIDSLDKALRDWREIDRVFASPTPHIECASAEEAEAMNSAISENPNFKIKKFFAHTGKFSFASPEMKGVEAIENEILTLAKMISGTTGVPVHFLGLPDLLSNRSTADNLSQLIYSATLKEREIWKGAIKELVDKAIAIYNEAVFKNKSSLQKLDSAKVGIDIPYDSEAIWLHLEKVLVPLALAGKISDDYLLSQIPGLDVEDERKKKDEKDNSEIAKLREENDRLTSEALDRELISGEGGGNAVSQRARLPIDRS